MTAPDHDPDLHVVPRTKPLPKLLNTAATETAVVDPGAIPLPPPTSGLTHFLFYIGTALLAGFIAASANYWFQHEFAAPARPISVLKTIRQALPTPPSPPLRVSPDSLHVTAIVLGRIPLAVVNGKQLAEGDWLELRTDSGVAALHVVKIEDGAVRFGYGGEIISAQFDGRPPAK